LTRSSYHLHCHLYAALCLRCACALICICWLAPLDTFAQMLLNLHKTGWENGLELQDYPHHCDHNVKTIEKMLDLAKLYVPHATVRARMCARVAGLLLLLLLLL
jgi:hypothetical protein